MRDDLRILGIDSRVKTHMTCDQCNLPLGDSSVRCLPVGTVGAIKNLREFREDHSCATRVEGVLTCVNPSIYAAIGAVVGADAFAGSA